MFGFFRKKQVDPEKIDAFCKWFAEKSDAIIASFQNIENDKNTAMLFLDLTEKELTTVYRDGYKGNIEFEWGFNDNMKKFELCLFHMGDSYLLKVIPLIKARLEPMISEKWFITTSR